MAAVRPLIIDAGAIRQFNPLTDTLVGGIGLVNFGNKRNSGLTIGALPFPMLIPFAATIVGWWARVDGSCTIKFWKRASAQEPDNTFSINTSGLAVTSGITKSLTLSDFTTTTISADDVIVPEITTIPGSLTNFQCGLIVSKS